MRDYICTLIEAESWDDDNFQDYYYEDGKRVPAGEPIGVELLIGDLSKPKLYLLDGIYFP